MPRLPRRSFRRGKRLVDALEASSAAARAGGRGGDEVLLDGERREDLAALGHEPDPGLRDAVGRQPVDGGALEADLRRRAAAAGP